MQHFGSLSELSFKSKNWKLSQRYISNVLRERSGKTTRSRSPPLFIKSMKIHPKAKKVSQAHDILPSTLHNWNLKACSVCPAWVASSVTTLTALQTFVCPANWICWFLSIRIHCVGSLFANQNSIMYEGGVKECNMLAKLIKTVQTVSIHTNSSSTFWRKFF